MIITNKHGLPDAFVKAAERNERPMADNEIRVTSLLSGARATELIRRHYDEIEVDACELFWAIIGTAVHKVLEETEERADEFREERLRMPISNSVLTGKSDVFLDGTIIDWKTCSVYKFLFKDFKDWEKQLKMYAMLWHSYGFDVKGGQIIAMMKDHKVREARLKSDYPDYPVGTVNFKFTDKDFEEIHKWAEERIKAIEAVRDLPDEDLPLCTPEERWNSGTKYAVMKNGRKTAYKVCDSEQEAYQWMKENGKGEYVEVRPGEDRKCLDYCTARSVCPYAKELMK